jgi:UDP-N-acetyl-D-mannosaminuronic acid dehydrogenase
LEKDPWIFIDCVFKKTGYLPKIIKAARETNEYLPFFVAERIKENLKKRNLDKETAKVFISGFAFKGRPSTDDMRGSPTLDLVRILKEDGFKNIYGHDFVVGAEKIKDLGIQPVNIEEGFSGADIAVIMNNHSSYENLDIEELLITMKKGGLFFDGWHIYDPKEIKKSGHINYEGLAV